MTDRWFRAYESILDDPKVQRLPLHLFKALINFWCLASENDGELPAVDEIAWRLRISEMEATDIIEALEARELLDRDGHGDGHGLRPHNWNGRQYKSDRYKDVTAAERQRRHRAKLKAASQTVTPSVTTVTPVTSHPSHTSPETETEAETEQQKTPSLRSGSPLEGDLLFPDSVLEQKPIKEGVSAREAGEFELFWTSYPHKVGKPAALKAWPRALRAARGGFYAILNGLERYIEQKPPDRPWLNPSTFLNQARWEDEPAAIATGPPGIIAAGYQMAERIREWEHEHGTGGDEGDDGGDAAEPTRPGNGSAPAVGAERRGDQRGGDDAPPGQGARAGGARAAEDPDDDAPAEPRQSG